MKTAVSLLIANIPSLAFLAASLWCLNHDHVGFAVTNIVFAVCFHNYINDDDDKEKK